MSDSPDVSTGHFSRGFDKDASIVLIGALGTGKSTLAIIAQKCFGLLPVDIACVAQQENSIGLSAAEDALQQHTKGCVIIWPARLLDESGLLLLKQYSKTHPIIHITRGVEGVQRYLKTVDASTVQSFLNVVNRVCRKCSNLEFHNLDEQLPGTAPASGLSVASTHETDATVFPRSLILKNLELAFVHFVNFTIRNSRRVGSQRQDGLLLPPSRSPYTYLLSVSLQELQDPDVRRKLNCGADVCQVEISLDRDAGQACDAKLMDDISRAMGILMRYFHGPVLYHIVYPQRQEFFLRYWALLRHGIRTGACYTTLDMSLSKDQLSRLIYNMAGQTLIVGTFHDNMVGANGWQAQRHWEMYETAQSLGMVGLRLTQPVSVFEDNLAVLGFRAKVAALSGRRPFLIAYNTGPEGRPSLYQNQVLTPVSTNLFRSESHGKNPITMDTAQKALFALSLWDAMSFYIIGVDVSQSLSPAIHRKAYQHFAMPHSFEPLSIAALDESRILLDDTQLGGISIAQGYKITIIPHVRAMSKDAKNIGAVNTLIPMRANCAFDGVGPPPNAFWLNRWRGGDVVGLYGENTDWIGMARCIHGGISPANAISPDTSALVVGAGGMARAAIYALIQLDVKHIVIYNRTPANAQKIAKHFSSITTVEAGSTPCPIVTTGFCGYSSGRPRSVAPADLDIRIIESREASWFDDLMQPTIAVSCVPGVRVGDQPGADFTLPLAWMRSSTGGVVLDLEYRPAMTPLLRQIHQQTHRGWVPLNGLENLTAQASVQFELFTGRRPPQGLMKWQAENM
jgi:shikimate 5-dehydrogenase